MTRNSLEKIANVNGGEIFALNVNFNVQNVAMRFLFAHLLLS